SPTMECLTLLGTAGDTAEWNSRNSSVGYKAIPLSSEGFVSKIPMISRLIYQFGVDLRAVLRPNQANVADLSRRTYSAFHVPEAVGSPYIPAQKHFVLAYGIRSVLGFGGILSEGSLFAVILFAKVLVPQHTADLFEDLGPVIKEAVEPF